MEVFKKAFEYALAHEKTKTALRTRRTYKKQITTLEKTITDLKTVLESKDSSIASMSTTISNMHSHLDNKKGEIVGLEAELGQVKTALEDKDRFHSMVLQKLTFQSNLFNATKKQLGHVTKEKEDQSSQIWKMLEDNCYLNNRILELDSEVHSLEILLQKMRFELKEAEEKNFILDRNMKVSQDGYELKCREVLDMVVQSQQMRASMFNLSNELDQWKRNSLWLNHSNSSAPMFPLSQVHASSAQLAPQQAQPSQPHAASQRTSPTAHFTNTASPDTNALPTRTASSIPMLNVPRLHSSSTTPSSSPSASPPSTSPGSSPLTSPTTSPTGSPPASPARVQLTVPPRPPTTPLILTPVQPLPPRPLSNLLTPVHPLPYHTAPNPTPPHAASALFIPVRISPPRSHSLSPLLTPVHPLVHYSAHAAQGASDASAAHSPPNRNAIEKT